MPLSPLHPVLQAYMTTVFAFNKAYAAVARTMLAALMAIAMSLPFDASLVHDLLNWPANIGGITSFWGETVANICQSDKVDAAKICFLLSKQGVI